MMTGTLTLLFLEKKCNSMINDVRWQFLKDVFHPAFLACVVSWLAFVAAIFMGHENVVTTEANQETTHARNAG